MTFKKKLKLLELLQVLADFFFFKTQTHSVIIICLMGSLLHFKLKLNEKSSLLKILRCVSNMRSAVLLPIPDDECPSSDRGGLSCETQASRRGRCSGDALGKGPAAFKTRPRIVLSGGGKNQSK